MTDQLHFTASEEANRLIATDPMALLIGFALDQQVTVQKAFSGPLVLLERVGSLDPGRLAEADLESAMSEKPAVHRFPGTMAKRVHDLAVYVCEHYDGDAAAVWTSAKTSDELAANIRALPGFGDMKVKSLAATLTKRMNVKLAAPLVPSHPTLGDVDSADALAAYQAAKKAHKAEWMAANS